MSDSAPVIFNYDDVITASGADPIGLRIAAPTDPDGDALTITLTGVPSDGTVEYFDGTDWVTATSSLVLTAAELTSLRYTPPASGEFGGETITYSVSDGTLTTMGTIGIDSHAESTQPEILLLAVSDSPSELNPDLYTIDANGTPTALPISPPNGSSPGIDGGFVEFAGSTYFNAADSTGNLQLYKMDASSAVTPVSDGAGGTFEHILGDNSHFTVIGGSLYFDAFQGGNDDVVRMNADGSFQAYNIDPGFISFAGQNGGFVAFDGSVFFSAITPQTNGFNPDLIRLDPNGTITDISTRAPGDIQFGSSAGEDGGFIVYNNALYFNAYSDTLGDTLFRLDAGSNTPVPVDPTGSTLLHEDTGTDSGFHVFGGDLYFNETDPTSGSNTLFQMDSAGDLTQIPDFFTGDPIEDAGTLGGYIDFAGLTVFTAQTADSDGTQLFVMDASGFATQFTFTSGGAFDVNLDSGFVLFDDAVYFDAYDGGGGDGLFKLDASGNITEVFDNGPGGATEAGIQGGFQVSDGSLYFSALTDNGYEIVKLNEDGSYVAYDLNSGAGESSVTPGAGQGFGLLNGNPLTGGNENDIIVGTANTETLNGGGGNDILESRGGNDTMIGGDGADTFVLTLTGAGNVVTLPDYALLGGPDGTLAYGDTIDLSALLDANFTANSNVSDFVRLVDFNGDLKLQVDTDGPGSGATWTDVAILPGANNMFVDDTVKVFFNGTDFTVTEGDIFNLHSVALAGGGWAVTWTQTAFQEDFGAGAGPYPTVFARVYDASGHQIGSTIQVSDPVDNMPDDNSILTALPNGNFAVTWEDCLDSIETQVYDANGNLVAGNGTGFNFLSVPDDSRELIAVTGLSNGDYAVLWQQTSLSHVSGDDIFAAVFDESGNIVTNPVAVSTGDGNLSNGNSFGGVEAGDTTAIVKLQDGFAVMWNAFRDDGSGTHDANVYVAVFDNAGNPVSGEIQANAPDGSNDFSNDIVALGGNNFAVQWENDSGGNLEVFTRFFSASDYTASSPARADANSDPDVTAEPAHLIALAGGGYASLWDQFDGVGNDTVYVQTFDSSGNIAAGSSAGGEPVNALAAEGESLGAVALAGGGFAVLYDLTVDDGVGTGPDDDTFVRIYGADGAPTTGEIRVNAANGLNDDPLQVVALPDGSMAVLWTQDDASANGGLEHIFLQQIAADGSLVGAAIHLGDTPSDLSNAQELSFINEFRAALGTQQNLLVAAINGDTIDLVNLIDNLTVGVQTVDGLLAVNSVSASAAASADFSASHSVTLAMTVGKTVIVAAGTEVLLSDGHTATYVSGSGTDTIVFAFNTTGGPTTLTLDSVSVGAITDDAGNTLDVSGAQVTPYTVTVTDTAANVAAHIDGLEADLTSIASVVLSGSPSLTITQTQFTNDPGILNKIVGAYDVTVTGVSGSAPNLDSTAAAPTYNAIEYVYDATHTLTETIYFNIDGTQTVMFAAGANVTFDDSASTHNDFFDLSQAATANMTGGSGNDTFIFGQNFDPTTDQFNGGGGTNNQLGLDGNYGPITLGANTITNIQVIALLGAHNYNLTTVDNNVAAGQSLTVWALNASSLTFNGAAETDGKFTVFGSAGNDTITGGHGADTIYGLGGADTMTGGAGADTFVYTAVSNSTGTNGSVSYDTITDFNAAADKFDFPVSVSTVAATITTGTLSLASFNTDLTAAVTAAALPLHDAVLFTPTAGGLAGHTFLIVDANGTAGYQAGADYVIDVTGITGTLGHSNFI